MPALTLKNIPDDIYLRLKEAAHLHHRSMNSEILYCLERVLSSRKIDIKERLSAAHKLRLMTRSHRLTDDLLAKVKGDGRP